MTDSRDFFDRQITVGAFVGYVAGNQLRVGRVTHVSSKRIRIRGNTCLSWDLNKKPSIGFCDAPRHLIVLPSDLLSTEVLDKLIGE